MWYWGGEEEVTIMSLELVSLKLVSKFLCAAGLAAFAAAFALAEPLAQTPVIITPSFNCSLAKSAIDKTICDDPKLAQADAVMGQLYAAAKTSAFGHGLSNEFAAQRQWLKEREDCGAFHKSVYKTRAECLSGRYEARNHDLAVATLFAGLPLALDTLRKIDPEAAPLYEAIVLYVNAPASWNLAGSPQRSRILQLLQPYFDDFRKDEQKGFGKDILQNEGISQPADALKSKHHFIQFLQIASAYLDGEPIPRPLPCAAIVRRPELIDASDAVFGSTLDNFILYPDCGETLPPLPQLERLNEQINKGWPDCEGSIRFSAYRFYSRAKNDARLASIGDINRFARSAEARRPMRMPKLRGVPLAAINAAVAELTAYYRTYQKAPLTEARAFARSKVRDIVASGRSCGE